MDLTMTDDETKNISTLAGEDLIKAMEEWAGRREHLAEDRTKLAQFRTKLAEERTALAHRRTQLAEKRTELASGRTELAEKRTELSGKRTELRLFSQAGEDRGIEKVGKKGPGRLRSHREVLSDEALSPGAPHHPAGPNLPGRKGLFSLPLRGGRAGVGVIRNGFRFSVLEI